MGNIIEIEYDIESTFDKDGIFPLVCTNMLFDVLKWNSNVLIKNQCVAKEKKTTVERILKNQKNIFYEHSFFPEGNYCLWIKDCLESGELSEVLNLQGIYMCCIQPTKVFDWNIFQNKWKSDEIYLFADNQASFVCKIIDMDRVLNLYFNEDYYSLHFVDNILYLWEVRIKSAFPLLDMKKTVFKNLKGKKGNSKTRVELYFGTTVS